MVSGALSRLTDEIGCRAFGARRHWMMSERSPFPEPNIKMCERQGTPTGDRETHWGRGGVE